MVSLLPPTRCCHCLSIPHKVLRCSRCSAAVYCNSNCQTQAFPTHKKHCKKIGEALKKLKEEGNGPEMKHFLRYDIPSKGHVSISCEYMNAIIILYEQYHYLGLAEQSKTALELSLSYRLQGLKVLLYQSDTTELYDGIDEFEWDILFNYIALDKVQEAYDFMVFWTYPDYWAVAGRPFTPRQYQNINYFLLWEQKRYIQGDPTRQLHLDQEVFRNIEAPRGLFLAMVLVKAKLLSQIHNFKKKKAQMEQFLVGTDPRLGRDSPILRIKNMDPVMRKITKYVVPAKPNFLSGKVVQDVEDSVAECLVRDLHMVNFIDPHGLYALTGEQSLKAPQFESYGKRAAVAAKLAKPIFNSMDNKEVVVMLAKQVTEYLVPEATKEKIKQISASYRTGVPVCTSRKHGKPDTKKTQLITVNPDGTLTPYN